MQPGVEQSERGKEKQRIHKSRESNKKKKRRARCTLVICAHYRSAICKCLNLQAIQGSRHIVYDQRRGIKPRRQVRMHKRYIISTSRLGRVGEGLRLGVMEMNERVVRRDSLRSFSVKLFVKGIMDMNVRTGGGDTGRAIGATDDQRPSRECDKLGDCEATRVSLRSVA